MTNEMLQKKIATLDPATAKKLMKKMVLGLILNPNLFTKENNDEEQLAWLEKELKKLGK